MKVEQNKKFEPIVITLETQAEAAKLAAVLDMRMIKESSDFLLALNKKLNSLIPKESLKEESLILEETCLVDIRGYIRRNGLDKYLASNPEYKKLNKK